MFKKSQKIVYPSQGVGEITDISTIKNSCGENLYYTIKFADSDITSCIPVKSAKSLGVAELPSLDEVEKGIKQIFRKRVMDEDKIKVIKSISSKDINTSDFGTISKIVGQILAYEEEKEKSLEVSLQSVLKKGSQFIDSVTQEVKGETVVNLNQ